MIWLYNIIILEKGEEFPVEIFVIKKIQTLQEQIILALRTQILHIYFHRRTHTRCHIGGKCIIFFHRI